MSGTNLFPNRERYFPFFPREDCDNVSCDHVSCDHVSCDHVSCRLTIHHRVGVSSYLAERRWSSMSERRAWSFCALTPSSNRYQFIQYIFGKPARLEERAAR